MGPESEDDAEVTRLIERIRQRIGPGESPRKDQELLQHFRPVAELEDATVMSQLLEQIDQLRHVRQSLPPFQTASRLPGGRVFHRVIGKSVRRDTAALAAQIDQLTDQIAVALEALLYAFGRLEAERVAHQDSVRATERARFVDSLDRLWSSHEASLHDQTALRKTVQSLIDSSTAASTPESFRPAFSSIAFADRFRGSRSDMLIRYADVADLLVETGGPVLDLGCGRGELVELVLSKAVAVRGVEVDPELVAFCRSVFFDVTECSALDALNNVDDDSLGGIAMIQVVEHLSPQQLADIVPLCLKKLRPGGLFVAETVNGTSPFVFTRSFFADPTHGNPVHHEYMKFLLEETGFSDIRIEWRSLVDASDRLAMIPESAYGEATSSEKGIVKDTNERLEKLDEFLFGPQDYLVVARK
ncbi:MAG TPA: methyltransferase domain-containing protein [Ilumatobacteraceae bacterium]